jgi:hypothetical protein
MAVRKMQAFGGSEMKTEDVLKCFRVCSICGNKVADCTCPSRFEIHRLQVEALLKERRPLKKEYRVKRR